MLQIVFLFLFPLNNTLADAMTEIFRKYTIIATFLKRSFHYRIERKSQDRPEHQYLEVRTSNSFIGYHNLIFQRTDGSANHYNVLITQPYSTLPSENMNTVPLDDLQLRARQLLNKLSKNSSGLVNERLLIPIAWDFMSYCDTEDIFANPVSSLSRDQISI